VIFRPHPQSFISDKEIIDSILNTFKKNTAFLLDKNRTAIEAMHKSDCMITDFSGVMFDYLYLFNKPVILATVDAPVGGYEAEEIESELWDVTMGKKLSIAYPENPDQLVDTIKNAIKNKDTIKDEILKVRDETIMNFGKAGEAIVDVSLEILNSL
jgi:CDP-glycerol glycerophosphotransferase (TagB/SpsB family)